MILKNTASQGVYLFASSKTTGAGLAGDQANITGAISRDGAAEAAFATANPTNIGGGLYWQPLSQAETNCNAFGLRWASSTTDILVEPLVGFTDQGRIDAAITSRAAAATALTNATWTDAKAAFLDAAITGRAPSSTALSNATWTDAKAAFLDAAVTSRLAPTVAARTLDVSSGGEAGIDWANVGSPTTTVNLGNTNVGSVATVTTVTGNVGGSVASVVGGVTLASGTHAGAVIPTVTTLTNLPAVTTDWLTAAGVKADAVTKIQAGLSTLSGTIAANVTQWAGTPVPAPTVAGVPKVDVTHVAGSATSEVTTGELVDAVWDEPRGTRTAGTFGAYLDAAVSAAGGGSGVTLVELQDELTTRNLTTANGAKLGALTFTVAGIVDANLKRALDAVPTPTDPATIADAVWDAAPAGTPLSTFAAAVRDVSNASPASGSLGEAVNDAGGGGSGLTAADVWASTTRTLTSGANIALAKGTGVTGFNDVAATAIVSGGAIATSGGAASATLVSTGLDAIPMTLNAAPSTFREWFVWLTLRFRKTARNKSTGVISIYGTNGTTVVTTQPSTDTVSQETTGVAS